MEVEAIDIKGQTFIDKRRTNSAMKHVSKINTGAEVKSENEDYTGVEVDKKDDMNIKTDHESKLKRNKIDEAISTVKFMSKYLSEASEKDRSANLYTTSQTKQKINKTMAEDIVSRYS